MKIYNFRPFKRLSDEELIHKMHDTFDHLKADDRYYKEKFTLCDQLIREAKTRNISCSKEMLYKNCLNK
ncbi:hypothetical protein [Inediibacterium massiliense]|uniref:hypothetical protein n=1 Tax=Inediibacterium massiliense TaxID=1658111 RepID=UPI0006B44BC1|nr:hypothetical protein [Inediibacterium massiliense]